MTKKISKVNETKEYVGSKPDYKADGIAVWANTDKYGQTYLAVKLAGHNVVSAFINKDKGGAQQ